MKVYEIITNKIIEELEKGVIPWRCPWQRQLPMNFKSKKRYRGVNTFLLQVANFNSPYWLSFKQVGELGGKVKKGEKGTIIVFWKLLEYDTNEKKEDLEDKKIVPLLRYYRVWNLDQTEGIDYKLPDEKKTEIELIDKAEEIINNMPNKPSIEFGGQRAFYRSSEDLVQIPYKEKFFSAAGYYSTLFHELGHSTGHKSRLNRSGITEIAAKGSENYSKEELVAEMSSSFLLGEIGLANDAEMKNQAAYIGSWLQVLKNDARFVIQAAAQAQKATDFILGRFQSEDEG